MSECIANDCLHSGAFRYLSSITWKQVFPQRLSCVVARRDACLRACARVDKPICLKGTYNGFVSTSQGSASCAPMLNIGRLHKKCANVQLLGALSKATGIIHWVNMELANVPQYLSLVQMASQVHRSLTPPSPQRPPPPHHPPPSSAFKLKHAVEVYSGVKSLKDQRGAKCALRFKLMMRPRLIQRQWLKLEAWTLIKGLLYDFVSLVPSAS